jgi:myo-inositol-hexaphosphate 3-phosphohydrolase
MSRVTEIYNANVIRLQAQLNATIRRINLMRISNIIKKKIIIVAINASNANLKRLTDKYKKEMPKKRTAFLVGINYTGTVNELYGCINDTKNVEELLKNKYNFTNVALLHLFSFKTPILYENL